MLSFPQNHSYDFSNRYFDEMFDKNGNVRPHYALIYEQLSNMKPAVHQLKQQALQQRMLEEGITFTLYSPNQTDALERTIPFDYIPRVIAHQEWQLLERGFKQRVQALNAFIHDIYHKQHIVRDGIIPRSIIVSNTYFRFEMINLDVPGGVYITTSGIDLIRDETGEYFVLEDNLRSPSGFSYLFKGRTLTKELFSDLYLKSAVTDTENSLNHFLSSLKAISPNSKSNPTIALLTPGAFNSAYYEHAFLAQQMGIHLVEGRDLLYKDHKIYIKTLNGLLQVDVLYRRIDDDFLDPLAFNPNSLLGVPGLMNAYRAGNIAIANAPGTGVADDKAIYAYVPDMIKYYLNEEPIIKNVPTYILSRKHDLEYTLDNLKDLVVKETSLSGGYGMLIGPTSSPQEIEKFRKSIIATPEKYVAQTTKLLSRAPVMDNGKLVPRHIDLRGFILRGEDTHVIPGGLTRVALKEGSLVVNSSQGGGVKDTWVLKKEI